MTLEAILTNLLFFLSCLIFSWIAAKNCEGKIEFQVMNLYDWSRQNIQRPNPRLKLGCISLKLGNAL